MARGRGSRGSDSTSGRDRRSIASAAAPEDFDEAWLENIRERFDARYIDLTRYEDRRRWHPSKLGAWTKRPLPRGLRFRPRIIVVPEKHRLARLATYGGRRSLRSVLLGEEFAHVPVRKWREFREHDTGRIGHEYRLGDVRRLGFAMPWQVVICIRRHRRREVLHALRIAGRKGLGAGRRQRRGEYSDVRC